MTHPGRDGLKFDGELLAAWMDTQGLGDGALTEIRPLGGGTQNVVVAFQRAGRTYVVRRPPLHKREGADETMRREALILDTLAGTPVPHPHLIAACADPGIIGASFYLMEPVDGFNPMEGALPEPYASDLKAQHAIGIDMVDALVALSGIDVMDGPLRDLGRADDWIGRQIPRWTRRLDSYLEISGYKPPVPDITAKVSNWLGTRQPQRWQPGLVHGDYHLANIMIRAGLTGLAAIVDWELASIGDPLLDLGHLLVTWPAADGPGVFPVDAIPGLPTRDELIERYAQTSMRGLEDLRWFRVLAGLRLAAVLDGTYARSLQGKVPHDQGQQFRQMSRNLLENAHSLCD